MLFQQIARDQGGVPGGGKDDFYEKPGDQQCFCYRFCIGVVTDTGDHGTDRSCAKLRKCHQFADPRDFGATADFLIGLVNPLRIGPQSVFDGGIVAGG